MKTTNISHSKTKAGYWVLTILTLSTVIGFSNRLFSAEVPLEKLLSSDIGVCIRCPELQKRINEFDHSAFYIALKKSSFYEKWKNHKSHAALETSLRQFEVKTGHSFQELLDDFVGDSTCLAFSPDKKNPKKTVVIFLTRAQSPQHIDKWLNLWKKENPNRKIKTARYQNYEYSIQSSIRKDKSQTTPKAQYYAKLGRVFVLTDTEEDMRTVIDRYNRLQKQGSHHSVTQGTLHDARWYRIAVENLSKKSILQIIVNPRVWDGMMASNPIKNNFFTALWKSSDSIAMGIQFQHGPVLEAYVGYRFQNLPKDWQKFIKRSEGATDFLNHVPSNAIFFGSGRHDLSTVIRSFIDVASSTEGRKLLGYFKAMDLAMKSISRIEKFLPALKNNWGVFLVARDSQNAKRVPFDGLIALEVPKSKISQAQLAARLFLEGLMKTSFEALSLAYNNNKPAELRSQMNSEQTKEGKLTWIESIGSFQPAYSMTSRYLLVSGSPNLIRNHLARKSKNSMQAHPAYRKISRAHFPKFSQILFLNTSELVLLLEKNKDYFSQLASRSEAITPEVAQSRLVATQEFLQITEAIFLAMNIKKNGIKLTTGAVRIAPGK